MKFKKLAMKERDKIIITYVFDLGIIQIRGRRIKYV